MKKTQVQLLHLLEGLGLRLVALLHLGLHLREVLLQQRVLFLGVPLDQGVFQFGQLLRVRLRQRALLFRHRLLLLARGLLALELDLGEILL